MTSYISEYIQDKLAEYQKYERKSARLRTLLTDLAVVGLKRDHKTILAINNMLGGAAATTEELATALKEYTKRTGKDFNYFEKDQSVRSTSTWETTRKVYQRYASKYPKLTGTKLRDQVEADISGLSVPSKSRFRADAPEFKPSVVTNDIDTIIEEMNEKLKQLALEQFTEIEARIDAFVKTIQEKEAAHAEEVAKLTSDMDALQNNADEASKAKIQELEADIKAATEEKAAQVQAHKAEIDKITTKLSALRDVLNKKEAAINTQKDKILGKLA